MNLSFQMIAAGVAILVFAVIGILLLTPGEKARRGRRRSGGADDTEKTEAPGKDWQSVSLHLERHIQSLRRAVDEHEKKERTLERDLEVQKEKYSKLQEKLAQERDWQKKEEEDVEKKSREIATLKMNVRKMEDDLNHTHSERLKFERELREAKGEVESLTQTRRTLELQVQKLEAETDNMRKQIKELKWETTQLSHKLADKKEAESWVPKQDFEKLQADLRDKDRELSRLREQIKKEVL